MIRSDLPVAYAFPATSGQQRLWWLEQASPGSARYVVAKALRLEGALDVSALREACVAVVRRHEMLRTSFRERDGVLQQIVHEEEALDFALENLDAKTDRLQPPGDEVECRRAEVFARAHAEAQRPFDLTRLPLMRVRVYRLGAEEHLLAIMLHHIACDAWSMIVLLRDVATAYQAAVTTSVIALPPPSLQYADYAVWEEHRAASAATEQGVERWREMLDGAPTRLSWPADGVRVADDPGGAIASTTLDAGTARLIEDAARAQGLTPFMVAAAAFGLVLCRWTGQSEVLVATPVLDRPQRDLEDTVGFFVNTVPLRVRVDPALGVRQWLSGVRETVVSALQHADVPFERIVGAAQPEREAGMMPLCQAIVVLQHADRALSLGPVRATVVPLDTATSKFDVSLIVVDQADGWTLTLEYRTDLFEPATAAQLVRQAAAALSEIARGGDGTIGDLDLLEPTTREMIVGAWNATAAPYPRDAGVHELVAARAGRTPGAVAVRDGNVVLSYRALQTRADRLAAALAQAGVGPGSAVATLVEPGADAIACWLAILARGAAYVPFDPGEAGPRLAEMLEAAGVRQMVAPAAVDGLPGSVEILSLEALLSANAPPATRVAGGGDDPAYVMFTSGSTGRPKGVVVRHRGISRLVLGTDYVALDEHDVVAHAANVAFDATTFEVWAALIAGATVAIVPRDVLVSPGRLEATQRALGLTVIFLTTAVFNLVARERPSALAGFRYVLFGGEAADCGAVSQICRVGRPAHLVHVYGPTECTTFATAEEITGLPDSRADVPIGRPIGHTTAYVCDERGRLVPPGVRGELYLGGDGVAAGYIAEAAITATRFVADPFGAPGDRLYRTGDVARWRHDGSLVFVGRTDDQVKIRGFRVEPGEVTRALLAHPAVREAAVIAVREAQGTRALRAAIVCRDPADDRIDAVQAFLASRLPAYMRPSIVLAVDALPLTANGKIDRRQLEARLAAAAPPVREIVSPRDALEATLVQLWEDLLGVSPVGTTDDFFALGGHSLLAAEMLERAERIVGRRAALASLLERPTIRGLSDALFEAEYGGEVPAFVPIRPAGCRPPLFFLHGDLNGGGFYTRALVRELDADQPFIVVPPIGIDGREVPASIEQLAERHVNTLIAAYPDGPYALAGYCHGGLLAFEMARCLTARGRQVAFVGIVHATAHNARFAAVDALLKRVQRVCGWTEPERVALMLRVQAFVLALRGSSARRRVAFLWSKVRRLLRRETVSEVPAPGALPPAARGRHAPALYSTYLRLVAAYVPRRWDGPVSVFLPQESFAGDEVGGWERVASRLEVHRIPGGHRTCITTHVGALGQAINRALANCAIGRAVDRSIVEDRQTSDCRTQR